MKLARLAVIFFIFFSFSHDGCTQNDDVGSGRAIQFDGVNDYINFGDRYSDLTFPFTISAWVNTNNSSPVFASRNNNPLYNGFWFFVRYDFIFVEYGDGYGGGYPEYRAGKKADVTGIANRWNHVTAVVRGIHDIDLYLNGVNVGGYSTGESGSPMYSNVPGGNSTAGYFLSNGFKYFFSGTLDDIRLWHKALTQEDVRRDMCVNLTGNEPGLIGYWDFNETSGDVVFDKSPNKFNGQFVGNPKRVFSGAPIGDRSTYLYATSWSGSTVTFTDGDHAVTVKNVTGPVSGVQLYEVKSQPSQTGDLDMTQSNSPYFGVFLVSQYPNVSFDAEYSYKGNTTCSLFSREDNSKPSWSKVDNPMKGKLERAEILKSSGSHASLNLGDDYKIICDQSSYGIATGITDPQFTFLWNTGETTSSILASQNGTYSVQVFGACGVVKDSVTLNFQVTPEPISLGPDKLICNKASYEISTGTTPPQFGFQWNTGETSSSIVVTRTGVYSVKGVGFCGVVGDTIRITFEEQPELFSLGDDEQFCEFTPKLLQPVSDSEGYTFLWQDGSENPTFEARTFGKYWVTVKNSCGQATDSITFSNKSTPVGFVPNVITPNDDDENQYFMVEENVVGLVSLLVVNRWGREVYYSAAYDNKWDGGNLASGVYYVLLTDVCSNRVKGSLTIIR